MALAKERSLTSPVSTKRRIASGCRDQTPGPLVQRTGITERPLAPPTGRGAAAPAGIGCAPTPELATWARAPIGARATRTPAPTVLVSPARKSEASLGPKRPGPKALEAGTIAKPGILMGLIIAGLGRTEPHSSSPKPPIPQGPA